MSAGMRLATALMAMSFVQGCDLIDSTLEAMDVNDPVKTINAPVSYVTYIPGLVVEPEPAPPPPPVCDPTVVVNLWRGNKYNCEGQIIGTYDIG